MEKTILRFVWAGEIERTKKVYGVLSAFVSSACMQGLQISKWMNITTNYPGNRGTSLLIMLMGHSEQASGEYQLRHRLCYSEFSN